MNRLLSLIASLFSILLFSSSGLAASKAIQQVTTTTLCENFQPTISGDGKKVVFLADCVIIPGGNPDQNYEVFLFDTETKRFTQITETIGMGKNGSLTLNGDGTLVAFTSSADLVPGQNADGNAEIFLYDVREKKIHQLTRTAPPAFSSGASLGLNGERVAFLSSADLVPGENREGKTEIFLFEKKTGRFIQLTHTPLSPPAGPGPAKIFTSGATLSGDGTKVIITSMADLVPGENREGRRQFFSYDLSKKRLAQLPIKGAAGPGHQHGALAVSDDGSKIAFLYSPSPAHEEHAGELAEQRQAIYILDAPGGESALVARASDCQLHNPSMSGDGTKVTFASTCDFTGENKDPNGSNMEIFFYNTTTRKFTQLTNTIRDFNHTPSIDRAGARIAFGSDRDINRGGNLDENSEIFLALLP